MVNTLEDNEPQRGIEARNELDSNADTCCLGTNFLPMQSTQRTADVFPYNSSYKPLLNVPIVTGATAYTVPNTDEVIILIFLEALYYGTKLGHSLNNPNQL